MFSARSGKKAPYLSSNATRWRRQFGYRCPTREDIQGRDPEKRGEGRCPNYSKTGGANDLLRTGSAGSYAGTTRPTDTPAPPARKRRKQSQDGAVRRPRSLGSERQSSKYTRAMKPRAKRENRRNRATGGQIDFQDLRRKREMGENKPQKLPHFGETNQKDRWPSMGDTNGGPPRDPPQECRKAQV